MTEIIKMSKKEVRGLHNAAKKMKPKANLLAHLNPVLKPAQ